MFCKRDLLSYDSRGTLTQTIVNQVEREEDKSDISSEGRDSIHSDWSNLLPVSRKVEYRPTNNVVKATTAGKGSVEKSHAHP